MPGSLAARVRIGAAARRKTGVGDLPFVFHPPAVDQGCTEFGVEAALVVGVVEDEEIIHIAADDDL
eukprot:4271853-Pleurochrysis_carterae.AAC.1